MPQPSSLRPGILLLALIGAPAGADQEPRWTLDVLIGDAHNFTSSTRIERAGAPAVELNGDYETRGFESPLHYTVRIARWDDDRAWELELLHHKLYLKNRPAGVESLSVSHGFNVVSLNRAYAVNAWRFRVGAGPVIAHPEARIDGASYDGPYQLAGLAALGGIGAQVELTPRLSFLAEVVATFGYADVDPDGVSDLQFTIRNPAVHAQIGLGYRF